MRKLVVALLLILSPLLLGGCPSVSPPSKVGVSKELPLPLQQAQAAINEANILLTATANVVSQNLKDEVITKTEAQAYVSKLKQLALQVDEAQTLVKIGDAAAADKAKLVHNLIVLLHREVASRARKEGGKS